VLPLRDGASPLVTGKRYTPGVAASGMLAVNENVPSPLSANACVALPPILLRSADTLKPVLAGFVPGTGVTVSVVDPDGATLDGIATPEPLNAPGVSTVSTMFVLPLRDCASAIATGKL
jgi:hypothetical protein